MGVGEEKGAGEVTFFKSSYINPIFWFKQMDVLITGLQALGLLENQTPNTVRCMTKIGELPTVGMRNICLSHRELIVGNPLINASLGSLALPPVEVEAMGTPGTSVVLCLKVPLPLTTLHSPPIALHAILLQGSTTGSVQCNHSHVFPSILGPVRTLKCQAFSSCS